MSKSDVVNLLESAGLSRSNQYNIVEQGKVAQLISMKEHEMLDLFKEIAGTRTYDDRRKESLKIMTDTDNRTEQIQDVIQFIEKRLGELEEEKSELKEYQKLDSQRRCLEYTLYDKEMKKHKELLEQNDATRTKVSQKSESFFTRANEAEAERVDAEEKIKSLSDIISRDVPAKKRLEKEYQRVLKEKANLELTITDQTDRLRLSSESQESNREELASLEEKIVTLTRERKTLQRNYDAKVKVEEKLRDRLAFCKQRVNELYAKQGRKNAFGSKRERDKYLQQQIAEVRRHLKSVKNV